MTNRVIFLHILKCGGTSLRYALADQYGYDLVAPVPVGGFTGQVEYPTLRGINPLVYQASVTPEMMKDYYVVMSHYDWRITNRLPIWSVITMFRHPVEQLHSLHRFIQWNNDLKIIHADVQQMSFMEWMTSGKAKMHLNTQTRYMSAHGVESIKVALQHLRDNRLTFGLVERFEESINLFNQKFGWSLDLLHENRTPIQKKLSQDEIALATELQADDMRLYKEACELFESRVQ